MKKRILCLLMALALLTGCTAPAPEAAPAATAAPAQVPDDIIAAPIGDAGLAYSATAVLWLPSADGLTLLTSYQPLDFTYSLHPAETILRSLLAHPGDARVTPASPVAVVPAGKNPVEVAGGVATVNLSAAALELVPQALYTLCLSITATLCELPDVNYVNVLVGGRAIALDAGGWLPLGSLRHQAGQEIPILWEQLLARAVPDGMLPTSVPVTSTVTLYFPLADGSGIVPEARRVTFAGQHPQQLVQGMLEALSAGSAELSGVSDLPDLLALMTTAPEITTLEDGSLRATLRFSGDLRSWITAAGGDAACTFAALVYTLTTFVPNLSQVCIFTGERGVTSVACSAHGSLLFPGALHARADYSAYLMAQCTLYAASGGMLTPQTAALPYRSIRSPRALLLHLPTGNQPGAVLPEPIADSDVLGLSVQGDTLIINLSARYATVLRNAPQSQRLAACAIVNTMCGGLGVRRVRFCFDSATVSTLGAGTLWSGEFLFAPGLIR
ncbi:MAG: GerMN domain-containing protein [Clostridia bacterium]|nr:GerMN domain-containing protein [Clostridia bacterium]